MTTTAPGTMDQDHVMLQELGRSWGLVFTFGVLSVLLGLPAVFWTGAAIVTVAILFAIQLFIAGVFGIIRGVQQRI